MVELKIHGISKNRAGNCTFQNYFPNCFANNELLFQFLFSPKGLLTHRHRRNHDFSLYTRMYINQCEAGECWASWSRVKEPTALFSPLWCCSRDIGVSALEFVGRLPVHGDSVRSRRRDPDSGVRHSRDRLLSVSVVSRLPRQALTGAALAGEEWHHWVPNWGRRRPQWSQRRSQVCWDTECNRWRWIF